MAANYVLLEKITVGAAGASSVTFANIPQTGYTDLKIVASARSTTTTGSVTIGFNGVTTNLSGRYMQGVGTGTPTSSTYTTQIANMSISSDTTFTFGNFELYIPNYTSANNKSFSADSVTENNATTAYANLVAGLWSSTAAITSITLTGAFAQYSTFSLYGLAAVGATPAIDPKATGGDIIQTDGTYWYHAFLSSGTFTPKVGLTCDVLVVAGGGGANGGGGGAGGVFYASAQSLANASTQTVTIGAGGAGGTAGYPYGAASNGANSVFGSLTAAVGGGGGGGYNSTPAGCAGNNGGSGGGGGGDGNAGTSPGGTGTSGQGNNGGTNGAFSSSPYVSGAGGGAGSAGGNATSSTVAGTGGAGTNAYSSWLSATGLGVSGYIAGGGGGGSYSTGATPGAGGSGGGGAGSSAGNGTNGTPNTGGGGGGGNATQATGGSGVVIVRYLA